MKFVKPKPGTTFLTAICVIIIFQLFSVRSVFAQSSSIEWQRCYGGPARDYAFDVSPAKDGGFIIADYTDASSGDVAGHHGNANVGDFLVIKTDKEILNGEDLLEVLQ
jgi:hypothetical protein